MLTRSLAIVPSLIVALIGGPSAAGKLIIIASVCRPPTFFICSYLISHYVLIKKDFNVLKLVKYIQSLVFIFIGLAFKYSGDFSYQARKSFILFLLRIGIKKRHLNAQGSCHCRVRKSSDIHSFDPAC